METASIGATEGAKEGKDKTRATLTLVGTTRPPPVYSYGRNEQGP